MKPVDPGRPMHVPSKLPHVEGEPAPKAPEGKEYVLTSEFTTLGILLAIFLFPIGIICLLAMRKRYWVLVDPDARSRDVELGPSYKDHKSGVAFRSGIGYVFGGSSAFGGGDGGGGGGGGGGDCGGGFGGGGDCGGGGGDCGGGF
ncbi:hypothetical protein BSKO_14081 [Bryopsis sp. KO-2023]|nr:hypothetical protein BSKO_14081 [Bryopsis sp. KO-2023]